MTGLALPLLVRLASEEEGGGSSITIGEHTEREFLGMTFNIDTIISTLIAAGIVLILGLLVLRSRL